MKNFQVTIGSTTNTPLIAANQPNVYASWVCLQDNAGGSLRFGGSTCSPTVGIVISASGGSVTGQFNFPRGTLLNNWCIAGTSGNVIDVAYEQSE